MLETVFLNALWILGLAIILTGFSYADWQATVNGVKLRQLLALPAFQIVLSGGLTLISLALALLASTWWERLIWLVFAGLFVLQMWQSRKQTDVK